MRFDLFKQVVILMTLVVVSAYCQTVSIYDPVLKSSILKQLALDENTVITKALTDTVHALTVANSNISNISGLEHFTKLRFLDLSNNIIRDIGPLSRLDIGDSSRIYINLSSNMISNPAPVSGIKANVIDVNFRDNAIQNFSSLVSQVDLVNGTEKIINYTGQEEQRPTIEKHKTKFLNFFAVKDTANDAKYDFYTRGWSTKSEVGTINFGDGTKQEIECVGFTNIVSHTYTQSGEFAITWTLGGESTSLNLVLSPSDIPENNLPQAFMLYQNYPNPFNPTTTIRYNILNAGQVDLIIYNVNGQVVDRLVSSKHLAGKYQIQYNASAISSGLYFYKLTVKSPNGGMLYNSVKKMAITK